MVTKIFRGARRGSTAIIMPMKPTITEANPSQPTGSFKMGNERMATKSGIVKITRVNIVNGILEAAAKRQTIDPSPRIALSM